jgi:hypothetical protein
MTIRTSAKTLKEEAQINADLIRYMEELLAPEKPKKAQPRRTRKAA